MVLSRLFAQARVEDELIGRKLTCAWCHDLVVFCEDCDKRQRYCSEECAKLGRRMSLRLAGARYQSTFDGKRNHAARQEAYEIRLREKLTHQLFSLDRSSEIVEQAEQTTDQGYQPQPATPVLHCNSCGRRCDFVVRHYHGSSSRQRRKHFQGEQHDSFKGDRASGFAFVPC